MATCRCVLYQNGGGLFCLEVVGTANFGLHIVFIDLAERHALEVL